MLPRVMESQKVSQGSGTDLSSHTLEGRNNPANTLFSDSIPAQELQDNAFVLFKLPRLYLLHTNLGFKLVITKAG